MQLLMLLITTLPLIEDIQMKVIYIERKEQLQITAEAGLQNYLQSQ